MPPPQKSDQYSPCWTRRNGATASSSGAATAASFDDIELFVAIRGFTFVSFGARRSMSSIKPESSKSCAISRAERRSSKARVEPRGASD